MTSQDYDYSIINGVAVFRRFLDAFRPPTTAPSVTETTHPTPPPTPPTTETCPICLDDFNKDEFINCNNNHIACCYKCLSRMTDEKCPMCRRNLFTTTITTTTTTTTTTISSQRIERPLSNRQIAQRRRREREREERRVRELERRERLRDERNARVVRDAYRSRRNDTSRRMYPRLPSRPNLVPYNDPFFD
jgi:uncharacterized Zn finger protein (UPF0148 family)